MGRSWILRGEGLPILGWGEGAPTNEFTNFFKELHEIEKFERPSLDPSLL